MVNCVSLCYVLLLQKKHIKRMVQFLNIRMAILLNLMRRLKMLTFLKNLFTTKTPVESTPPSPKPLEVEPVPLVQLEQVAPVEPLQSTEPVVVSPEPVPTPAPVPAQKPTPKKQPVANSRSQKSVPAKKKK